MTTDPKQAEAAVREAVAKARNVAPDDLDVELRPDGALTLFRTAIKSKNGKSNSFNAGVVEGGHVVLTPIDAMTKVIRAWHYDAKHPVPPGKVAEAIGFLQGTEYPSTRALLKMPDSINPEYKAHLFAPRNTTVDGHPAVEWWIQASPIEDTPPPWWRTRLVIPTSGPVKLETKEISDFL